MKLRKPCGHVDDDYPEGHYEPHTYFMDVPIFHDCPGGVFLPDDTLIIDPRTCDECDGRGTICAPHEDIPHDGGCRCSTCHGSGREYVVRPYPWPQWANPIVALLDALSVREAE